MRDVVTMTDRTVVAIDGKTVRRSFKNGNRRSAIHMVNAWASVNNMVVRGGLNDYCVVSEIDIQSLRQFQSWYIWRGGRAFKRSPGVL